METLAAPTTRFVTLTITEKGYALDGSGALDTTNPMIRADVAEPNAPTSAMGFILLASERRRAAGTSPLCVLSCDNLPSNGDRLRGACADLADAQNKPELARHVREAMRFPNSMVDSITPATDDGVHGRGGGRAGPARRSLRTA